MKGNGVALRFIGRAAVAGVLGFGGLVSPALADTRAGIDVALTGRVSRNPFGVDANQGDATTVAISPDISPWLTLSDPDTRAEFHGDLLIDQYARRYGTDTTGFADASLVQNLSPGLTMRAGAHYTSSNIGVHNLLLNRQVAADVVGTPGELLPDVTTAGTRTRINTINARLGFDIAASQRDHFTIDFNGSRTRTSVPGSSDYLYGTATLGYDRQVAEHTSATLTLQLSDVNYVNKLEGDGIIFNPQAGVKQQLGPNWELSISAGASIARIKRASGVSDSFTTFSGNARLCDRLSNGQFCLSAARTAQPTAIGGVSASTDATAELDLTLSREDRISATARYSRVDQSTALPGRTTDFVGGWVTYTRQFNDRFSLFVAPSYSKIFDDSATRPANWQLSVGVRYRFGAIR